MDNFELAKDHFLKGMAYLENQDFQNAEFHFLESLKFLPNRISTLTNLSAAQFKLKKYFEAKTSAKKAIALDPANSEAYLNLALIEKDLKNYITALDLLNKALQLNPYSIEALINKGAVLNELRQYDEALLTHKNAIALDPNSSKAWSNQGVTLNELRRYEEALAAHKKALELDPQSCKAWSNQGVTLNELRRYEEALKSYKQALKINPNDSEAAWNLSLIQLLLGDFKNGWVNYEQRWQIEHAEPYRHIGIHPLRNLDDLLGKKILVWSEQGFGDTIQFSRYINNLINLGADIIFEVQAPLKSLLKNTLKTCRVIAQGEPIKDSIDFQIPLLSLPYLLGALIETTPNYTPYLSSSSEKLAFWHERLKLDKRRLNIGIAFSGRPTHRNDAARSMDPKYLEPLTKMGQLFVTQKDIRPIDEEFLKYHLDIINLEQEIQSFEDTAAILSNMDLIVSVDTSIAHLAGALGKPTYALLPWNPEWRWQLEDKSSRWYPTMRLIRQPSPGDWESCIQTTITELKENC
ncbi:hypothetical protein A8O14_00740 [Polynucleobacter wuianus]|uniref:Uncharacterized protein n=1 Tax=Polynucleobacter wuianus TaxID=1743168 RepID=A0A191UCL4_9BURK|nr:MULTISPECIES: tetratricopeptide repeat protein [Polynucleobacter]ANI98754.1 hypothetical protein A8O14_00740 [Polynucleobacter wuianus]MBU3553317.1 tetratricopeptide repeat protein [Polynucleobacter sp. MWH-Post4-6-1]MBU3610061.1 tetratricopeptide repeat protein [Polynucleobacter wuianus]